MTPFEQVFNRLRDLIPSLDTQPGKTVQATQLIHEWLKAGCDAERDILPAINAAFAKMKGSPSSPAYFDKPVTLAHQVRTKPAEEQKRKDEIRAANIRWHRDRGLTTTSVGHQDYKWLEEYEQQQGGAQ